MPTGASGYDPKYSTFKPDAHADSKRFQLPKQPRSDVAPKRTDNREQDKKNVQSGKTSTAVEKDKESLPQFNTVSAVLTKTVQMCYHLVSSSCRSRCWFQHGSTTLSSSSTDCTAQIGKQWLLCSLETRGRRCVGDNCPNFCKLSRAVIVSKIHKHIAEFTDYSMFFSL